MKKEDFAKKESVSTRSGGHVSWQVYDIDMLKKYLEQCQCKPGLLAKELNVSYSTLRRWLIKANLWSMVDIKEHKCKGGRKRTTTKDKFGYIYAGPEHDYVDSQGDKKRMPLHIVIAEQTLGRKLKDDEVVHHVNLDKQDNTPTNLFVCDNALHRKMHQDLEHLAGRLMGAGQIAFVPEIEQYIFVGDQPKLKIDIGKGFVNVVDLMGTDATVVNAARVSFGKRIDQIRDQDKNLLEYLATHGHTSPFRHCSVQFHVKAPEFVARQWYKHVIGTEYSFKDHSWNEISGRYVEYDVEHWHPEHLRKQASDKKQGSMDEYVENECEILEEYKQKIDDMHNYYLKLISQGVCKEQARTVLPVNFYTEWYWTASLQAISHFVKLRTDPHAQVEIQDYANIVNDCMLKLFPNAWRALKL